MRHPLYAIDPGKRRLVFIPLLIFTLVVMVALNILGKPLQNPVAPAGIISYELAGDPATASEILDSWSDTDKIYAGFNLGLDFLFLTAYSTTIALAIIISTDQQYSRRGVFFLLLVLVWGQWLAASLDAIENSALFAMLVGSPASPLPEISFWCAVIKFSLVLAGITVVLFALIVRFFRKIRPATDESGE